MTSRKMKTAGTNLPVPQDNSEAETAIHEIGNLRREVLRLEAQMNDEISTIRLKYGEKVQPLQEAATAKVEGLQMFAEANRARLTRDNKVKFHRFATGEISWRLRPARVIPRGVPDIIAAIKAAGLKKKFLRIEEKLNKEAMLEKDNRQQAAAIKGITIGTDGEDFIVEPFETELAEAS